MLLDKIKKTKNRFRAYPTHQAVQTSGSTATYRRAVAEYGVPKEVLTDNGRQYTNWRGKSRFEQ